MQLIFKSSANIISLSRLPLFGLWAFLHFHESIWNIPIVLLIIFTDFIDGFVARKLKIESTKGAIIDASCDSLVVIAAFIILGLKDFRYLLLLGGIAASLITWSAYCISSCEMLYSSFGKFNGGACYIVMLTASVIHTFFNDGALARIIIESITIFGTTALLLITAVLNIFSIYKFKNL
ncbi:MAG: CDP-alcohol phosphatidyltransferase family protein [Spirochaetales bacterium]|nr:CDP-alcohol phosphatidyltransferase family protein [Spirochaetales bacterium]